MNTFITNGTKGFDVFSDTSAHPNPNGWECIKALGGDVVINTAAGSFAANALDGKTLSNGDFLPGVFTSITLTSGTLVAFKG